MILFEFFFFINIILSSKVTVDKCTLANLPNIINKNYSVTADICGNQGKGCCLFNLNYSIPRADPLATQIVFNNSYCVLLGEYDNNTIIDLERAMFYYYSHEINFTYFNEIPSSYSFYSTMGTNFNPPLFWYYYKNNMTTFNNSNPPEDYSNNPYNVSVKFTCNNVNTSFSNNIFFNVYILLLIIIMISI